MKTQSIDNTKRPVNILKSIEPGVRCSVTANSTQLVLCSKSSVQLRSNNIAWCSDRVVAKADSTLLSRIIGIREPLVTLTNPGTSAVVVGLCNQSGGPPLFVSASPLVDSSASEKQNNADSDGLSDSWINDSHQSEGGVLETSLDFGQGLYCNMESFVFAAKGVKITKTVLPIQDISSARATLLGLRRPVYLLEIVDNCEDDFSLCLQTSVPILEKTLQAGESFHVNTSAFIGMESSCSAKLSKAVEGLADTMLPMIEVQGPGKVMFAASSHAKAVAQLKKPILMSTMLGVLLHFFLMICFVYALSIMTKSFIQFEFLDNLQGNLPNNNQN